MPLHTIGILYPYDRNKLLTKPFIRPVRQVHPPRQTNDLSFSRPILEKNLSFFPHCAAEWHFVVVILQPKSKINQNYYNNERENYYLL